MDRRQIYTNLSRLGHQPSFIFAAQFGVNRNNSIATLRLLNEKGKLTAGQIAQSLSITPASVTNIIKKLEAAHVAQRIKSEEDSRVTYVVITDSGKKLLRDTSEASQSMTDALFAGFSDSEIDQLNSFLDRLYVNITDEQFSSFIKSIFVSDDQWDAMAQLSTHFERAREIMMSSQDQVEFRQKYYSEMKKWHSQIAQVDE
ncbi:MarR family transcriptional regulator [Alloscardovia theropitheci]|uniref:MarR family transcriptional regulator n=1 Tax=Alloscardovia theropitheci TaxID=2496842 RepID=A0A4R0QQY1_9BIFI|nr:MarR family transcriptional regulator [Alloscardovia theropitheci]TCD54743.1 MarR family transcriptional regulator [Alloscardovia theropitheci]